jgi:hypothetical protein
MKSISGGKLAIIALVIVVITGGGLVLYNYYFVRTLMLSEVIGKTDNPQIEILVNLFDFNTGLTRYDVNRIEGRSFYWEKQIKRINAIQDPKKRELESQKLVAEMMKDPVIKKIVQRVFGLGLGNLIKSFTKVREGYPVGNKGWWLFWLQ